VSMDSARGEAGQGIPDFCGKPVREEELKLVREVLKSCHLPRTELADTVCELLGWNRANGRLKGRECREWLEKLEAGGFLTLPLPSRRVCRTSRSQVQLTPSGEAGEPIEAALREVSPVDLVRVQSKPELNRWKELISRYHYLGYRVPFGASLRYFIHLTVKGQGRVAGCLQFSSPAWRLAARDRWIGWSDGVRARRLQHIVAHSRFLILPWVRVPHLASHALSRACALLSADWEGLYAVRPLLLETFVEESRAGTCYRAANWIHLGSTRGRGRMDRGHIGGESIKTVWVYPLEKRAREMLRGE
jgi:hypothetical protein